MSALDIYVLLGYVYFAVLVGMVLWMMSRADTSMLVVALVLLLNFAFNQFYSDKTGEVSPWWFRLGIDALSAFLLTMQPYGRVQSRVAEFFIVMVVLSSVIGVGALLGTIDAGDRALAWRYDVTLSAVGVVQLIYFVVSGGIYGGGKRNPAWARSSPPSRLAMAKSATRQAGGE